VINVIISIAGFGLAAVFSRGAAASAARMLAARGRSAGRG
jgi:hypothetical protein